MSPEREQLLELARKHFQSHVEPAAVGLIYVYKDMQSDFVVSISKPYCASWAYYNESFITRPDNLYPDVISAVKADIERAEFFGIYDINIRHFDILDGEIDS